VGVVGESNVGDMGDAGVDTDFICGEGSWRYGSGGEPVRECEDGGGRESDKNSCGCGCDADVKLDEVLCLGTAAGVGSSTSMTVSTKSLVFENASIPVPFDDC
jgi:hypothetical protein